MSLLALPFKFLPVLAFIALCLVAFDVGGVQRPAFDAYFSACTWFVDTLIGPAFDRLGSTAG